MAGDWIKMRVGLDQEDEVIGIAADLEISETHVVGLLHKVWSWADQHTDGGNAVSVTSQWLDRNAGVTGLSRSMCKHGWLVIKNGIVSFPSFDKHMGKNGRLRAQNADRQAKFRNAGSVTLPLPDKREDIEEKNTTYSSGRVKKSASKPVKKKARKPREPDLIWDTIVAGWFSANLSDNDRTRIGLLVKLFKQKAIDADEIPVRRERYNRIGFVQGQRPDPCTPEALLKHWDRFGPESEGPTPETNPMLAIEETEP